MSKRKAKFKVGQVVKMLAYRKEYARIKVVWPWTWADEFGVWHKKGFGYTLSILDPPGKDQCNEKFLRPLTKREAGR